MTKRKSKGAYMISSVAEMYGIHPQTLRLYEREGLLKPSRTEGNTRLYTDEDLQRLEFILSLARDLGVNISGMAIILQMRERMEEMQRQIQEFVQYIQEEVLTRANAAADPAKGAIVPVRRSMAIAAVQPGKKRLGAVSIQHSAYNPLVVILGSSSSLIWLTAECRLLSAECFPSSSSIATVITCPSARMSSLPKNIAEFATGCSGAGSPRRTIFLSQNRPPMKTFCWCTRRSMYAN